MDVKAEHDIEAIYREHGDRLWWALLAYAGAADVASDAVSEAFAQALARGEAVRDPLRWVWKAAFKIAAGELERRRSSVPLDPTVAVDGPEPSELFEVLGRLSSRQRACIVLFHYVGYSQQETANILGIAGPTVSVHLVRGRRRLKDLLKEDHDA